MTLVDFLLARIAEDEADLEQFYAKDMADDFAYGGSDDYNQFTIGYGRALAECAAKRAILAHRKRIDLSAGMDDWYAGYSDANYDAVGALAAVYKDHPDYQQEWAV